VWLRAAPGRGLLRCLRSLPTEPASRVSKPSSSLRIAPRNRFRCASLTTSGRAAGRRSRRFRAAQLASLAFARDWLRAPARSLPPGAAAASARRRLCFRTCGGCGLATCRDVRNQNRFRLARTRPDGALLRSTPVSLAACRSPTGKVTGAAQLRFRWRLRADDATAERLPACPALFPGAFLRSDVCPPKRTTCAAPGLRFILARVPCHARSAQQISRLTQPQRARKPSVRSPLAGHMRELLPACACTSAFASCQTCRVFLLRLRCRSFDQPRRRGLLCFHCWLQRLPAGLAFPGEISFTRVALAQFRRRRSAC